MVDVGVQVPPVVGVLVRVGVAATGVLVRVEVRLGVAVGPVGVLVRVAVRVKVAVGPVGVLVRVAVRVKVAVGPTGVLVRVGVAGAAVFVGIVPPAVQLAVIFHGEDIGAVLGVSELLQRATHSLLL
jgi:hypothetical protein